MPDFYLQSKSQNYYLPTPARVFTSYRYIGQSLSPHTSARHFPVDNSDGRLREQILRGDPIGGLHRKTEPEHAGVRCVIGACACMEVCRVVFV